MNSSEEIETEIKEIEDSIENKIYNDEFYNVKEIKYLMNNHIETNSYDDTVIYKLHKSTLKYIDQLESNNQKLIEKLEKDIKKDKEDLKYNNLTDYGRGCLDTEQEILEILKGEKE